jgi:glycine cleavage system T protein
MGPPLRTSPFYSRLQDLGAVFGEKNGWERVNYFEPGKPWRNAWADQKAWGWKRPEYFEQVGKEHEAARESVAIIDMTSFGKIEVQGPRTVAFLQGLAANNIEKPVGSITYTQFLNNSGAIESDVTVTRLAEDTFRLISGTSFVSNDLGWIGMHMPEDGSVEIRDVTENWGCLSLWGPNARRVLESVSNSDVSNEAFPYMTAQGIDLKGAVVWAQRISYAGELGWELYVAPEEGVKVWDALMEAGKEFGIQPAGYKALDTLRIEKGYLYWSGDITSEDNPYEARLNFFVDLDKGDFIGREALLKIRNQGLRTRLCAVTMDANNNLYGGESVYVNGRIVGRIRTGNYGYSIGKDIGLVYLSVELARVGTEVEVETLGERISARVTVTPLVDLKGEKLRA